MDKLIYNRRVLLKNILIKLTRVKLFPVHKNYVRFILLGRARTGSSLVINLLNSHPHVITLGEAFHKQNGQEEGAMLRGIFSKKPVNIKAAGFKIFYNHPADKKDSTIWQLLAQDRGLKVVHIHRKNILRTIVSHEIAKKTQQWTNWDSDKKNLSVSDKQITIDKEKLAFLMEEYVANETKFASLFSSQQVMDIDYDDLMDNLNESMRKIQLFLELKPEYLETKLHKQNPESIKNLLLNYEELRQSFAGTKWSYMFNE